MIKTIDLRSNRLGIGNLLEVMHEQELEDSDKDDNSINDNEDYDKKSDTAEDFSDITELAEDLQVAMQVWAWFVWTIDGTSKWIESYFFL